MTGKWVGMAKPTARSGIIFMCLAWLLSGQCAWASKTDYAVHLKVDGRKRSYDVHLPPGYDGRKLLPVVILLHGGGGTPRRQRKITSLVAKSNKEQFVLVAPSGSGILKGEFLTWNSGRCCAYARWHHVNDIHFIAEVIDSLERDLAVDPDRIYVTGESNGGMLAYKIACQLSDKVAAVAPIAASMDGSESAPKFPVNVFAINGTADRAVKYNGGWGRAMLSRFPVFSQSVAYARSFWVGTDGCATQPEQEIAGNVTTERFHDGVGGAEVEICTIKGGKHCWPGGRKNWLLSDGVCKDISATDAIWDFFSRHTRIDTPLPVPVRSLVSEPAGSAAQKQKPD